ncbi:MAG TPA: protease inhibitor I42 family protein [Ktedonosporobacter sp.]|nr:protease inhibitor I42 family protein [Ktedonosporobacter sp.]
MQPKNNIPPVTEKIARHFHRLAFSRRDRSTMYLLCALGLLLLAACANQAGSNQTTLTSADQGKTVTVHTGDKIIIQLGENPSTGYTWAVASSDEQILKLQDSAYTATPPVQPGSGGTRTFTFVAQKSGTVPLQLKYWRSFEGDRSIVRRFEATIQVQ